jgi:O-antigen biosynthesis protein
MVLSRVAVLFDNKARPKTTGGYCLRALQELVQVQQFASYDRRQLPTSGFDLYLRIDDGMDATLPADLHPSAFWAIDTHLDFDRCLA